MSRLRQYALVRRNQVLAGLFLGACALGGAVAYVALDSQGVSMAAVASCRDSHSTEVPAEEGGVPGMVWVKGGTVTVGSSEHYPEERSPKAVSVAGFWIDRFEVTNAQFAKFVAATGYVTSAERAKQNGFPANGSAVFEETPGTGGGWRFVAGADWRHPDGPKSSIEGRDDYPVVQVSLDDVKAYARWAGRDLPTEAQWEFAARSGISGREFAWEGSLTPGGKHMANTWQGAFPFRNEGGDGYFGRAPVGCYPPNQLGLYDMIGNVWEWTASTYYPTHQPSTEMRVSKTGFDPRQPGAAVGVLKGGSYLCAPNYCGRYRPAARQAQETGLGTNHIGFRTVLNSTKRY